MNTPSNTNSQKIHKTMINNINKQIDGIINNKPQQITTLDELLKIAIKENNSMLFNIVSKKITKLKENNEENNSFQPDKHIKDIIKETSRNDLINNQSNYYKYIVEPLSKNITNKTETGEKKGFFSKIVNKFKKTEEPAKIQATPGSNGSAPGSNGSTNGSAPGSNATSTPELTSGAPEPVINQAKKKLTINQKNSKTENEQEEQSATSEPITQELNKQIRTEQEPNPTLAANGAGGSGGKRNTKKRTTKKSVKTDKRNGRPKKR